MSISDILIVVGIVFRSLDDFGFFRSGRLIRRGRILLLSVGQISDLLLIQIVDKLTWKIGILYLNLMGHLRGRCLNDDVLNVILNGRCATGTIYDYLTVRCVDLYALKILRVSIAITNDNFLRLILIDSGPRRVQLPG